MSDIPEAQHAAEQAGAVPGFGKRNMNTDEAQRRIVYALATVRSGGPAGETGKETSEGSER